MRRFIEGLRKNNPAKKAAQTATPLSKEEQQFVDEFVTRRFNITHALQQNPNLATLIVPELKDSSDRLFQNIPLFTYMLWTGDQYGMSLFLPDPESIADREFASICENLLKQVNEFKKHGVTFTHGKNQFDNHPKYSDQAHIDVLKQYVKMCEEGRAPEECKEFWIKTVGKVQQMVELHIAIKLCHADKTPPNLLSIFASNEKITKPIWFPLSTSKLGEDYAICAAAKASACEAPQPAFVKLMIEKLETYEAARQFHVDCIEEKLKALIKDVNDKIAANTAGNFSY